MNKIVLGLALSAIALSLIGLAVVFDRNRQVIQPLGYDRFEFIFSNSPGTSTQVPIDPTTSTVALAANRDRQFAVIYTTSSVQMLCSLGGTPARSAGTGMILSSTGSASHFAADGGAIILDRSGNMGPAFLGAINCIHRDPVTATRSVQVIEW